MKIKMKDIMCFLIYIVVALDLGYFSMRSNNIFRMMTLATVLSGIVFILYLYEKRKVSRSLNIISLFFILFYILFILNLIRYLLAPNSLISFTSVFDLLLMYSNYFQILLLGLPIAYLLKCEPEKLIKGIVFLGYLILTLKFLCWFEYNFLNRIVMPSFINENWKREVLGSTFVRVKGTFLDGFLFLYSFHKFIDEKKCCSLIEMVFVIFYTAIIYQSRANFLYMIATMLVTILLLPVKKNKFTNKVCFFLLLGLLFLANINLIITFINGFSVNSIKYGAGSRVRIEALSFFLYMVRKKSFLFGIGFTQDSFNNNLYYMSDLGIMANFLKFGILGIAVFLMPFACAISILFREGQKKLEEDPFYRLFFSLTLYLVIMQINLDPYMYSMIGIMPVFVGMLIYYFKEFGKRGTRWRIKF